MTSQKFAVNLPGVAGFDPTAFGAFVKGNREGQGLSRQDVQDRGGPSITTQKTIEDGGRKYRGDWLQPEVDAKTLTKLATGLGLSLDDVYKAAGRVPPPRPGARPAATGGREIPHDLDEEEWEILGPALDAIERRRKRLGK